MDMRSCIRNHKKTIILAIFWVFYGIFPVQLGLFFLKAIYPSWQDVLLYSLSVFGYGTFGVWAYALTGADRTPKTVLDRFYSAMLWNIGFFVYAILYSSSV